MVLRAAVWTLRQPRYAALSALMLVIAIICVAAGTWQISRFEQSVRDNAALKRNAHAAAVPLSAALVPLVGHGSAPGRDAIRYRTVTVAGSYLTQAPQFLRNQSQDGDNGYYVLSPLRTGDATLLVVRGFVAASSTGAPPTTVPAPPAGRVQLTGRLQTPESKHDDASKLPRGELESINPAEQAGRLGTPVFDASVALTTGQPGTTGLRVLPNPDLSNPAGGAYEAQHFAYIVQWYLFALLALAAPFAKARSEVREARQQFLGIDTGDEEFGLPAGDDPADQLQLTAGAATEGAPASALAVRANASVARRSEPTAEQWQRAERLADRYGRSLRMEQPPAGDQPSAPAGPRTTRAIKAGGVPDLPVTTRPNSADQPHRSADRFHGAYNDHLWELALADGQAPDVATPEVMPSPPSRPDTDDDPTPRPINRP